MSARKPLPIKLNSELDLTGETSALSKKADNEMEWEQRRQEIEEKLEIASEAAADALLEVIEDEDHKDRYSASVLVLKHKGLIRDRVSEEDVHQPSMASKDVLELVKEIGKMFVGDQKNVTPVREEDVTDV